MKRSIARRERQKKHKSRTVTTEWLSFLWKGIMRTRAGIILIENDKVALIERHRAGLDYYVFPGGGVDEGETPEQAAIREAREELGVEVAIKQKVAIIHFDLSTQVYFLVERVGGEFGTGAGRNSPIPILMTRDRESISQSGCRSMSWRSTKISFLKAWQNCS